MQLTNNAVDVICLNINKSNAFGCKNPFPPPPKKKKKGGSSLPSRGAPNFQKDGVILWFTNKQKHLHFQGGGGGQLHPPPPPPFRQACLDSMNACKYSIDINPLG